MELENLAIPIHVRCFLGSRKLSTHLFTFTIYIHSKPPRPKIENLIKIYRESFFNVPFARQRTVSHRKLHVEHEKRRGRKEYLKSEWGEKKNYHKEVFMSSFHLKPTKADDRGGSEDTEIK